MSSRVNGWSAVSVAGHECEVFEPLAPNPNGYVVLYLHGVHENRLSEQPVFTAEFERYGLYAVCPRTRRSWWTDRICPEFDPQLTARRFVLDHVVPMIQSRLEIEPPRIALLGTSMGGQGVLGLAYRYPDRFPVVAAISPAIDYHLKLELPDEGEPLAEMYEDPESARQDTAILHVHPLNWPRNQFFCCDPADLRWFDSADRLRMKLSSLGIPHECDLESSAGGHGFEYYNAMAPRAIRFLVNSMDSERLRIV